MKKLLLWGFLFCLMPLQMVAATSVDTSATATWAFTSGAAGQTATYTSGTDGYFSTNYVDKGSNLSYLSTSTTYNVTYTLFQPASQSTSATANDYVSFNLRPKSGLTFTPTSISFTCMRFGTDNGLIDVVWKSSDGTTTTIASALKPARNNSGAGTVATYDLSSLSISKSDSDCALYIYIYSIGTTKTVGLSNVVITGTLQGTPSTTPTHTLTTVVSPSVAGTLSNSPYGTVFDEGTSVTLTAATRNFGYKFKQWQDSKGNVLSTTSPYTITLQTDTTIYAIYDTVQTYTFNVSVTGSQWGTVSLSPSPTNNKYETGTAVTMAAVDDSVSTFINWDDNTTAKTKTVTVDGNKTYTATFSQKSFIVGWDLVTTEPRVSRAADYYSSTSNEGLLSAYTSDGTAFSWNATTANSIPYALFWTTFSTIKHPYYQASFSTTGYKNIVVHSMMYAYNSSFYPGQKLQYSTDGTTFTNLQTATLTASTWTHVNATLPDTLNNQAKVYLRWVANDSTTAVVNGNDGTGISNIYVFADEITTYDSIKPTLISSVPANGATGASATGSISLTFDKIVKIGSGDCTLGSTVLTPSVASKTVTFSYSNLSYNTQYTFTIPAGAITNKDGVAFGDTTITFTTLNRPVPTAKLFDAVVAKDGSGDYTTISAAISAAPASRTEAWLIFVKNGTYSEHVDIPSTKPYIHMIGQKRDSVIISGARLSGASTVYPDSTVYPVATGATFVVNSADCYFQNITFENKFGYDNLSGAQALALYTQNDRIVLNNCWLRSFQDTYLTAYGAASYRHYVKNCRIEGAVDFIYGGGDVFFDNCTIHCTRSTGGYIVAPGHLSTTTWGYVFSNCTIEGTSPSYTTYLGRPWSNSPRASFFNTTTKLNIYPVGWFSHMNAIPAVFADYNTMDSTGNALDLSSRIKDYWYVNSSGDTITGTAKNSYTSTEAAQFTLSNVLSGSDSWNPVEIVEPTANPSNVVNTLGTIKWDSTAYAICYVVIRDNKVIGFTTSNKFTDSNYKSSSTYSVMAAAESGTLSSATVASNSNGSAIVSATADGNIKAYYNGTKIIVTNIESGSKVMAYSVNGSLLYKQTATDSSISLPINPLPCIITVSNNNDFTSIKVIK